MTLVEVTLLVGIVLVVGGFLARTTALGRWLLIGAAGVVGILLATFGPELIADLF